MRIMLLIQQALTARKLEEEQGKKRLFTIIPRKLDTSLVISAEETAKRIANEHYVIRFKTPVNEPCICMILFGDVKFHLRR
jgi:glutamyl-tRNA synthetase